MSRNSTEYARMLTDYDYPKSLKDKISAPQVFLVDDTDDYEIIEKTLKSTGIFERTEEYTGRNYINYFIAEEVTDYIISEFRYSLSAKDIELRLNMSQKSWNFFLDRFDEIKSNL